MIYAISRPSKCGCCHRPVHVVETVETTTLVELNDQGEQVPHRCPAVAVARWVMTRTRMRAARVGR